MFNPALSATSNQEKSCGPRSLCYPACTARCLCTLASINNIKECVFLEKPAHITMRSSNHHEGRMPHHHFRYLLIFSLHRYRHYNTRHQVFHYPLLYLSNTLKRSCLVNPFKSFLFLSLIFKCIIYLSHSNSTNSDSVQ